LIRVDDGDEIAAITKLDEKEEEIEIVDSADSPEVIDPTNDSIDSANTTDLPEPDSTQ
jgi:hypothetical protein